MIYWCVYLPYFAFLGVVWAGLHYRNNWVIAFGIFALFVYDAKPELKLLHSYNICAKCHKEKKQ